MNNVNYTKYNIPVIITEMERVSMKHQKTAHVTQYPVISATVSHPFQFSTRSIPKINFVQK